MTRRQWLALTAGSGVLAGLGGCGGGGDSGDPSAVLFSADSASYHVGERATLMARFPSGADARIEPGIGAVQSGQPVRTPPLASSRSYRLVLSRAGQPDTVRELTLQVAWRNRWQAMELPFPLSMHASCAMADGTVLLIGGSRGLSSVSGTVNRFDPASGQCTEVAEMDSGRYECSVYRLNDGRVLVAGGFQALDEAAFAEVINPATGQTQRTGPLMQPRGRHSAVQLADGRVMLIGGLGRDSAEIWEPGTGGWRLLASRMTHSREWASSTLLADGRVLVLGGGTPSNVYQFAEIFDPHTELFLPLPLTGVPAQHRRYFHAAHRLGDGGVLVLGGNLQGDDLTPLASAWRIDVDGGHAVALPDLALPRGVIRSLLLPGDQVLLAGGQTGTRDAPDASRDVAFYGPTAQRVAAALPDPRAWHTLDLLPDGRVLLAGGEDAEGHIARSALVYD
jgi:hypothetical protein